MKPASVADYREAARRRLPRVLFDYIDGGSYAEETLAANVADIQALKLRQRVLKNVSKLSTATELFGQTLSMPVVLSPVGLAGMYARRGEAQAAKAAKAAGVPFTLSTVGVCTAGEVAQAAGTPPWFQLYMLHDRGFMADVLARTPPKSGARSWCSRSTWRSRAHAIATCATAWSPPPAPSGSRRRWTGSCTPNGCGTCT